MNDSQDVNLLYTDNKVFLTGLGFCGSAAIATFAGIRLIEGNYKLFALDVVISLLLLGLSIYVHRTGRVIVARRVAAITAVAGTLSTVYFNPASGIFWVYVSMVSLFYLLGYRLAALCSTLVFVGSIYLLQQQATLIELLPFLMTASLILVFSGLFSLTVDRMGTELQNLTLMDDLTETGNRRAFSEKVENLIHLNNRIGYDASLIYVDMDHFKEVNDRFGHNVGDQVLVEISSLIKSRLRKTDSLYRLGGDEFVIVAEGTNQDDATLLAEQLRESVENISLHKAPDVTISMGISQMRPEDTNDSWISRADEALYSAKEHGRNSVKAALAS